MNGFIWLGWATVILFAVISVLILKGKGIFLIVGFNTLSKVEREKYNIKRLSRIYGGGLSLITFLLAILMYFKGELPNYLQWIFPVGFSMIICVILILSNTICKRK